ncbi:MAG: protein translocase subunit SecD [Myxococcota bacterium]
MEGIYWFRIGSVFFLFVGSIWVLLPTVLRESAESRFAAAAQSVEAPVRSGAALDLELPVSAGDANDLAKALETRLKVAKVPVSDVKASRGQVLVKLSAGGSKEAVAALSRPPGVAKVHAIDAVIQLQPKGAVPAGTPSASGPVVDALKAALPADADYWATQIPRLAGLTVAADTVALPIAVGHGEPTDSGAKLSWSDGATFPAGIPLGAVTVDGRVAGVVLPDGALYTVGDPGDAIAMLASGPLPGKLGDPVPPKAAADDGAVAATEAAPSKVPAWLTGMLPDTAIPLGLDLQGGIDLTLQVELDDAVLGQVQRDSAYLKDQAAKEGVIVDSVRRSHTRPVLEITTAAPLGDLQTFLRKRAPEYVYVDSDGSEHHFELSDTRQEQVRDQAVEQVLETLRKRVNATGVKEPSIVKKSGGRINVQLPGMDDVQAAVDAIGTTAVLEFRMVDEEFDDAYLEQMLAAAKAEMPEDQFLDDELLDIWLWENNRLDEDRIILWEYQVDADGTDQRVQAYPLKAEIVLTGNDVNDAGVGWDQNQQPYVTLEFKPRGGQIFCDITGQAVGKRFAVILDNKVQSAPSIRERICGGAARIEMGGADDPMKDAQTLALVLRTGALDAPVVVASVRQVGASLGQDAIREGTIAAVLGSVLVYLFMVIWYKTSGVIADIALTVNVLMVLASLGLFGATLTLPGIAGIALTVGMAVDSNIIIYERIREELRLGVHPRKAVDIGFEKALVAVLDANITTAIAGIVLYSYGTGPIKGFAVTLLVGIVTTLVTAVFVTRTIMEVLTRSSAARLRI